jgi:hypothetical protein
MRAQELINQTFFTTMSEKNLPPLPETPPPSPDGVTLSPSGFVVSPTDVTLTPRKRKFCRKTDFPARDQWLKFLAFACRGLFNPYMPNRSGANFQSFFFCLFIVFPLGSKTAIVDELAATLMRFLFGGRRNLTYQTLLDDEVVAVNLSFPDEQGDLHISLVLFIFHFFIKVFVTEINLRLERRTNAEWGRMNDCKAAALAASLDGAVVDLVVSPLKKKRGPDQKHRKDRIIGEQLLPEPNTAFARAKKALNFVDDGDFLLLLNLHTYCSFLQARVPTRIPHHQLLLQTTSH